MEALIPLQNDLHHLSFASHLPAHVPLAVLRLGRNPVAHLECALNGVEWVLSDSTISIGFTLINARDFKEIGKANDEIPNQHLQEIKLNGLFYYYKKFSNDHFSKQI